MIFFLLSFNQDQLINIPVSFFTILFFIFLLYFKKIKNSFNKNIFLDLKETESNFTEDLDLIPNQENNSGIEVIEKTNITFDDIAGNEEAKNELKEVVRFLKDPKKFTKLGAKIPKGVLLSGPPGTGKTLLAKAIAGESNTTFLKISGSQFVELLVGVGAARVRELFEKARDLKPSIIFIDEIDSIARARSSADSMNGTNEEREQTLNQILTEMDGFKTDSQIVVIGATNRIDILDKAILRPGRFDRQITLIFPTLKEREAILKVHSRNKKIEPSVSISTVAQKTIGFSGADLANLLNEAAILSIRRKKKKISSHEINDSINKILIGLENTSLTRTKMRYLSAFRKIGDTLLSIVLETKNNFNKIKLSANNTKKRSPFSNMYTSRISFIKQIFVYLGGKATENMIGGSSESTIGTQKEILQFTQILRLMILRYAMSRLQALKQEQQKRNLYLLGSDVKQEFSNIMDIFTLYFLNVTYREIFSFLKKTRPISEKVVDELIKYEELKSSELRGLVDQYFLFLDSLEYSENNRKAMLFELIFFQLKKSINKIYKRKKNILEN